MYSHSTLFGGFGGKSPGFAAYLGQRNQEDFQAPKQPQYIAGKLCFAWWVQNSVLPMYDWAQNFS